MNKQPGAKKIRVIDLAILGFFEGEKTMVW